MLSENLKNAREKQRYTVKELSQLSGVSESTINNIENGRNENPGIQILLELSKVLKVAVSKLIK